MWFAINETGLVTNITMVWPAAVPCRTASVNTGLVVTSHRRVRVTWNCITGRQRLDDHHFGGNAGPGIAPRVTRGISRNYTTTVASIATVQYITHALSTIMTKSGAMSSLRLTYSHLRRRTEINPPLTTSTPRFLP